MPAPPGFSYRTQSASWIRRGIAALGLLPLAFGLWRSVRYWRPSQLVRDRRLRQEAAAGIPIPPGSLLLVTGASRDVEWFLDSGAATAKAFREVLAGIGRPIENFRAVLDFGCGCGRVLRQWRGIDGPAFHGTDYNRNLVGWCQAYLDDVTVQANAVSPPLGYETASFELCYSVSVFTHLPAAIQDQWLREIHRVLEPGGLLIVTLSGEGDLHRVTPAEQKRFRSGEIVVVDEVHAGTNMCGAYHPESFVREKWSRWFSVLRFVAEGAKGSPRQDLYVLERLNT